jgi:8-oxo-dGTP diphosphatase
MTFSLEPLTYQKWLDELEHKWQAGLIPDPQGVAIILLNMRGEVLLQLRDSSTNLDYANYWTLPGGVVEPDEVPEEAAHRELGEEIGLQISLSQWKVYRRQHHRRHFQVEQHVYVGEVKKEINELMVGEGQALRFFGRDEIPSLSIAFGFDKLLLEFFNDGQAHLGHDPSKAL